MIVALKHPLDIVADRPSPMRDLLLNSYFPPPRSLIARQVTS
jgi:hypothetical protein